MKEAIAFSIALLSLALACYIVAESLAVLVESGAIDVTF